MDDLVKLVLCLARWIFLNIRKDLYFIPPQKKTRHGNEGIKAVRYSEVNVAAGRHTLK